jgi:hypothetical protein
MQSAVECRAGSVSFLFTVGFTNKVGRLILLFIFLRCISNLYKTPVEKNLVAVVILKVRTCLYSFQ